MLKRNFSYALVLAIAFGLFAFSIPASAHPFDGGDGTSTTSPYLISTCEQLQLIDSESGIYLNSHFKLASDIDCATTTTWNEDGLNPGTYFGFEPIGSSTAPFTGSFDGGNYNISSLYVDRGDSYNVALFSYASSTSTTTPEFKNINFGDPDAQTGKANFRFGGGAVLLGASNGEVIIDNVNVYADVVGELGRTGGVAGYIGGEIKNSSFTGTINSSSSDTGGLIASSFTDGSIESIISNSSVNAGIASNSNNVGGLAGRFVGSVDGSSFQGSIDANGDNVGGLIGYNQNTSYQYLISNSNVDAVIVSTGNNVGGLGGYYIGSVYDSSFQGSIDANGDNAGGLIGLNNNSDYHYLISNSNVSAVIVSTGRYVGGLGGLYFGSVENSSFVGEINSKGGGSDGSNVGGIFGYNSANNTRSITNSHVEANIISEGYFNESKIFGGSVGGLAGFFRGSVYSSSFKGNINSSGSDSMNRGNVGGLIGNNPNSTSILDSFAEANISSDGTSTGGISGHYGGGVVSNVYFKGIINSQEDRVGGLFGQVIYGNIESSFVEGGIFSEGDLVGGIYGYGGSSILNSYFSGSVEGVNSVGGLVGGSFGGNRSYSYSKGNIVGNNLVGGISGNQGNINNCYSEMSIKILGESTGKASGIIAQRSGSGVSNSFFAGTIEDLSDSQSNTLYGIGDDFGPQIGLNGFWLDSSGATMGAPTGHDTEVYSLSEEGLKTLSNFLNDGWSIAGIDSHDEEGWYINEGYDYPRLSWENKKFYVEYLAEENGSITGSSTQIIVEGESTAEVVAVPDDGYVFLSWDDGNTSKTRQDLNVNSNIIVTANFEKKQSTSSFNPMACQLVEYGEWQESLPGFNVQFREVASSSPSGCYLTQEQRKGMERLINQDKEGSEENNNNKGEIGNNEENKTDLSSVMTRERNMVRNVNRVLSNRMAGRILLQVEEHGQAWYVDPKSTNKYFMGRPADAFQLMRNFGLGISEDNYYKFRDEEVPSRFAGQILLRVERNGEAYYVNPETLEMNYLGRPADAFKLMRELALGISNENLRQIQVGE